MEERSAGVRVLYFLVGALLAGFACWTFALSHHKDLSFDPEWLAFPRILSGSFAWFFIFKAVYCQGLDQWLHRVFARVTAAHVLWFLVSFFVADMVLLEVHLGGSFRDIAFMSGCGLGMLLATGMFLSVEADMERIRKKEKEGEAKD